MIHKSIGIYIHFPAVLYKKAIPYCSIDRSYGIDDNVTGWISWQILIT